MTKQCRFCEQQVNTSHWCYRQRRNVQFDDQVSFVGHGARVAEVPLLNEKYAINGILQATGARRL